MNSKMIKKAILLCTTFLTIGCSAGSGGNSLSSTEAKKIFDQFNEDYEEYKANPKEYSYFSYESTTITDDTGVMQNGYSVSLTELKSTFYTYVDNIESTFYDNDEETGDEIEVTVFYDKDFQKSGKYIDVDGSLVYWGYSTGAVYYTPASYHEPDIRDGKMRTTIEEADPVKAEKKFMTDFHNDYQGFLSNLITYSDTVFTTFKSLLSYSSSGVKCLSKGEGHLYVELKMSGMEYKCEFNDSKLSYYSTVVDYSSYPAQIAGLDYKKLETIIKLSYF